MVFLKVCAHVHSHAHIADVHACQNISKVGYAQICFKRSFWRKICVWYYFCTHTCLKDEKLIEAVDAGVHKLRMPVIDGGLARTVWFLSMFASSFFQVFRSIFTVILCYSCNIQINFQRRADSVMGFNIIVIAVISKGFANVYFHNVFSFCCTDNLILGAPFWILRTWLWAIQALKAQLSLISISAVVVHCFCCSDLHWQFRLTGKEGYKI